jgi:putative tryptophan/tyrosine transport system substrate-binding protein
MPDMRRRQFISLLGGAAVWPLGARAQQQRRHRPLIAWLGGTSPHLVQRNLNAFLEGLREHGYEAGTQIDIVYRWSGGDLPREPILASELVALNPAVIVTASPTGTVAVRRSTSTIPIVGALIIDPVRLGLAESYNRPGGNVTGILSTIDSLPGKQLELLLQLIPQATAIGVLLNPANPTHSKMLRDVEAAVRGTPIRFVSTEVSSPTELEGAIEKLKRDGAEGLLVFTDGIFFTEVARIISLTAATKLPSIHSFRQHIEQGGLMSYGVDVPQSFRRMAYFVDRILKGTRPGDLPIELPTKMELAINLKTAKSLGLEVPSTLLARADEVIE